jgi:hypothetical protein
MLYEYVMIPCGNVDHYKTFERWSQYLDDKKRALDRLQQRLRMMRLTLPPAPRTANAALRYDRNYG